MAHKDSPTEKQIHRLKYLCDTCVVPLPQVEFMSRGGVGTYIRHIESRFNIHPTITRKLLTTIRVYSNGDVETESRKG